VGPRAALLSAALASIAFIASLASCVEDPRGMGDGGALAPPPHADLACAVCHQGDRADLGQPAVPGYTCASSDCHSDGGPAQITLSTVTFRHRDHAAPDAAVDMSCAGCHSHRSGDEPILARTDACSLCHAELLRGGSGSDCRYCHTRPTHEGITGQGVAVPHAELPWIQGECLRCHYDVSEPGQQVSAGACVTCHQSRTRITAAGIGRDLHPTHTGVGCTTCHTSGDHHIVAMSSAVVLDCAHCHAQVHGVDLSPEWAGSSMCAGCHTDIHELEQRLVIGVLPDLQAFPSQKFLDGLTCRSCHVATPRNDGVSQAVVGSSVSCTGCHTPEYATILGWWAEGSAQRHRSADAYLSAAERALGALGAPSSDSVTNLLGDARRLLTITTDAGPEHNLALAHRVLTEVLDRTRDAYARAGRSAPVAPDLGTRPRRGLCSNCHYRLEDARRMSITSMDPAQERFHREVLGVGDLSGG
jgi:hypothetical protein